MTCIEALVDFVEEWIDKNPRYRTTFSLDHQYKRREELEKARDMILRFKYGGSHTPIDLAVNDLFLLHCLTTLGAALTARDYLNPGSQCDYWRYPGDLAGLHHVLEAMRDVLDPYYGCWIPLKEGKPEGYTEYLNDTEKPKTPFMFPSSDSK
jgi:hypothetical protein